MAVLIGVLLLVALVLVALLANAFLSAAAALFVGFVIGTAFGVSAGRRAAETPKPYNPDDHSFEEREAMERWIESEHRRGNL